MFTSELYYIIFNVVIQFKRMNNIDEQINKNSNEITKTQLILKKTQKKKHNNNKNKNTIRS